MTRNLFTALLLCLLAFVPAVLAQQQTVRPTAPIGLEAAKSTSVNDLIANTAWTVTLTAPSSNITIVNASTSTSLYMNLAGTATTSNFLIPAGAAFTFTGLPPVKTFSLIGSAASGSYAVFAH